MTWALLAASLAALFFGVLLRFRAMKQAEEIDQAAQLFYQDDDGETLVSDRHALTGRPDYILKDGEELVPIERKSREVTSTGAHEGELLQLAAYCLLVEEHFGKPVHREQLQYANRTLEFPFDQALRAKLFSAMQELREASRLSNVPRSHNNPGRCRRCGFRRTCKDSLV